MTADNDWDVFSGHGVYTVHYSGIHKRARSSAEYTRLYWKRSLSRKQRTSHSAGPRSTINISGDGSREQATGERAESNEKWFLAQQQTTTATTTQITTTTTTTKTTTTTTTTTTQITTTTTTTTMAQITTTTTTKTKSMTWRNDKKTTTTTTTKTTA